MQFGLVPVKEKSLVEKVFRLVWLALGSMQLPERVGNGTPTDDLWVISFTGRDRPGLIRDILKEPALQNVNIVDMDQRVMQGIFVMSVVADFGSSRVTANVLEDWFRENAGSLAVEVTFFSLGQRQGLHPSKKNLHVVTILAKDRVGIIRDVADVAARNKVNVERSSVTARGDLISIEFLMDFAGCNADDCRKLIKRDCERLGLDVVIQDLCSSLKEKRLIVFDMDMTIVDFEIINRLASFGGVDEQVKAITEMAMNGEMDFKESLRQRVRLLKGMPLATLQEIASDLRLTPGSEELLHHLKHVGYKIALISGGFTYFTDVLKERLGFDYTFANELEIKDGVLTGEIKGDIIDAEAKGRIIFSLAELEMISPDPAATCCTLPPRSC